VPRYKLTIAYDGTDFCGWQKQEPFAPDGAGLDDSPRPGEGIELKLQPQGMVLREGEARPRVLMRTVQEVVERAVREIVREPVNLKGASRTDSGVHARGQVAAFTCSPASPDLVQTLELGEPPTVVPGASAELAANEADSRGHGGWPIGRGVERLRQALNGRLPEDVVVTACEVAPDDFDPISHCTSKGYSYTIHASRERALWDRRFVQQVWEPLDVAKMQQAAAGFVGEHDFAAFAAAGHGRLTTVRTIYACAVTDLGGSRVRIDVSGSGFLYNMVRIIAGTLVEVGRGKIARERIGEIIEGKNRRNAGPTLPAQGLCLEWIRY